MFRDGSAYGSAFRSHLLPIALVSSPVRRLTCTDGRLCRPRPGECIPGGQGVAGSNPAVPTSSRLFSNIFPLRKSQQKSQLVVQRPRHRPAPRACHGTPPGHAPRQNNRQAHQARRQRSLSHPGPALRPRTPSPAHPPTAGRTLTGVPQLQDAGKPGCTNQACPRRRGREAAGIRAAPRTGRHDRSDLHRPPETRPHPRHGESAVQVSSQCAIPANEFPTLKLAAQQMPSRNKCASCRFGAAKWWRWPGRRWLPIVVLCAACAAGWVRDAVWHFGGTAGGTARALRRWSSGTGWWLVREGRSLPEARDSPERRGRSRLRPGGSCGFSRLAGDEAWAAVWGRPRFWCELVT